MAKKTPARNTRRTPTGRRKSPPVPRRRWRIPLDSLVRLNRADSVDVQSQGDASVTIKDRAYQIEPLDLARHSSLRLNPNRHYRAIALDEPGLVQRYLLVRQQKSFSAERTYLVVSESEAEADVIAHVHLLGGYADKSELSLDLKEPRSVGVAEAILTPIGSPEPAQPADSQATAPQPPPLDEDLLQCIDLLNSLQERYPEAENDLAEVQKQFHDYVQRRYNLEVISIFRGQTAYDENQGHRQASVSRFSKVDDGIITAVRSDGYRRDTQEVARSAQVVVNRHSSQIVKIGKLFSIRPGRLYVEIHAAEEILADNVIYETAVQAKTLELLYSWLTIYHVAETATFKQLAGQLDGELPSDRSMREALKTAHDRPLRLSYFHRGAYSHVIIHGEAAALQAMHDILRAEALHRDNIRCHVEPDWPLAELRQLRPNAPTGLKIQEFNEMTSQFLTRIRELLDQIAFAPEFVA